MIWALRRHFEVFRDVEFAKGVYNRLVVEPATWILDYRDHNGLPLPSWDLWEERRGVHLFTVCATIGALRAAHDFARDMGALDRAEEFRAGAESMTRAMLRVMWDAERGRFEPHEAKGGHDTASAARGGDAGAGWVHLSTVTA